MSRKRHFTKRSTGVVDKGTRKKPANLLVRWISVIAMYFLRSIVFTEVIMPCLEVIKKVLVEAKEFIKDLFN